MIPRLQTLAVLACAALPAAGVLGSAALATPSSSTTRVSVNSNGVQGDGFSAVAAISADGRFVAFHSEAKNLVPGDTNGAFDVFVRDRKTGKTTRVSVNSHGKQGNGDSLFPSISADGRFVTFQSVATNLVGGDTNHAVDSFVRDRKTGKTERVSVNSQGKQGDASSYTGAISADGRFVAFPSQATNLVGGDTNDRGDVLVRDRETGKTTRVSVSSHGKQGNDSSSSASISADGRLVAFQSSASNLVGGDTNGAEDAFVYDRETGKTTRVSVDSQGAQANSGSDSYSASISADGRFVAFQSSARNLVAGDTRGVIDVFVRDLGSGKTTRVSVDSHGAQGNNNSSQASISANGRYIAFHSTASNLVGGDTNGRKDVFVRDRNASTTRRVSVGLHGGAGNGVSASGVVSGDGRFVAFHSTASNLVAGDTNGVLDVFVRPLQP